MLSGETVDAFFDNCTFCVNKMKSSKSAVQTSQAKPNGQHPFNAYLQRIDSKEARVANEMEAAMKEGRSARAVMEKAGISTYLAGNRIHLILAEEQCRSRAVSMTIQLHPQDYGHIAAGAKVHDITPEEMIERLLETTLCNWANDYYQISE